MTYRATDGAARSVAVEISTTKGLLVGKNQQARQITDLSWKSFPRRGARSVVGSHDGGASMDIDADGQWMTYEELAEVRGIDRQSARRLASRLKWRRQKDNRQIVRVYVPSMSAMPQREKRDISAGMPAVTSADMSVVIRPLEAAVTSLREQLARERARADQAEARADRGEVRVDGGLNPRLSDAECRPGQFCQRRPLADRGG